jgi:hypothetical protein
MIDMINISNYRQQAEEALWRLVVEDTASVELWVAKNNEAVVHFQRQNTATGGESRFVLS